MDAKKKQTPPSTSIPDDGLNIQTADWLLIPNILTMARLLFAVPAVILILVKSEGTQYDHIAALLLVISFVTDGLDGIVARALDQRSYLGKILDPIIDKLVVISVSVTLVLTERQYEFPIAVLIAMVVRDGTIITLAMRTLRKNHHLFTSRWMGKTTMFVVCATLLVQLLADWFSPVIVTTLPWVAFGLLLLSSVDYLLVYIKLKKSQRNPQPD